MGFSVMRGGEIVAEGTPEDVAAAFGAVLERAGLTGPDGEGASATARRFARGATVAILLLGLFTVLAVTAALASLYLAGSWGLTWLVGRLYLRGHDGWMALARAERLEVTHVKPHGALYNMAARQRELAEAVVRAVHAGQVPQ